MSLQVIGISLLRKQLKEGDPAFFFLFTILPWDLPPGAKVFYDSSNNSFQFPELPDQLS